LTWLVAPKLSATNLESSMKTSPFLLSLLLALSASLPARALISEHGREPVYGSGWSEPVTQLINHPSRVGGRVGPFGPVAEFWYSGTPETLNEVLKIYSRIPGRQAAIYLTTDGGKGPLTLKTAIDGTPTLTLHVNRPAELKGWKVPRDLRVERLDVFRRTTAAHNSAEEATMERAIRRFVARHSPLTAKPGVSREAASQRLRE
jgi:hypothetical protein